MRNKKIMFGLNTATISEKNVFRQINIASKIGFQAIGLWIDDIGWNANENEIIEYLNYAKEENILINEMCFLKAFKNKNRSFNDVLKDCEYVANIANLLDCKVLVAVPAFDNNEDLTFEEYIELNVIANSFNTEICLEPAANAKHYNSLNRAILLTEQSSIKLVLDSFHFFVGQSNIDQLINFDAEKIALIHLSDGEHYSLETLKQTKHDLRTYLGDGILPINDFFDVLNKINCKANYNIEIWNKEINRQDSETVAEKALKSAIKYCNKNITTN